MEKIVNLLIDEAVQNADTYTNNGSTQYVNDVIENGKKI
jgi:transcription termination factor NusB